MPSPARPTDSGQAAKKLTNTIEFFETGFLSDCTVKCGDRVWKLHKLILCANSKFFKAAFTGGFEEANTGELVLRELDPAKVDDALRFVYAGNLDHLNNTFNFKSGNVAKDICDMLKAAMSLYSVAQFLRLDALCQEITNRVLLYNKKEARKMQTEWKRARWYSDRAPRFSAGTTFSSLAKQAYDMPPAKKNEVSMRQPFRDYFIFRRFAYLTHSALLHLLRHDAPNLLIDIIQDMMKYGVPTDLPPKPGRSRCSKCRQDPLAPVIAKPEKKKRPGSATSTSGSAQEEDTGTNFWMTSEVCYECSVSSK
ncbi:hypothetical protein QBC34DRAFT_431077 [Podospora aff. communis PSN243]|uniref:BTB domain-containing protein n=1 Tax=Podospora aff. communis PSN243 TaxID=3040156 RepID=A0AAV9G216_9PEZI|nr:hypothetical protein QBC34DRAFT_431077 [Podospora aff. communis PSN243]